MMKLRRSSSSGSRFHNIIAVVVYSLFFLSGVAYAQTEAQVNQCTDREWCVEFNSFSSTLDGGNNDDITIIYDASQPAIDGTSKYYKITLLDGTSCSTPIDTTTSGVSPIAVDGSIPYSDYTPESGSVTTHGTLTVGLDIDTTKIETGGLQQNVDTAANTFDVRFCAKMDLFSSIAGEEDDVEVATSKTYLTLSFDKNLEFEFEITSSSEAAGEGTVDVAMNYNLKSCICAIGVDGGTPNFYNNNHGCIASYTALRPGDVFTFCIQSLDTEVMVTGLSNVAFKNSDGTHGSGVNIPILNNGGYGVGPASNADCFTQPGVCIVEAVTYARMYETLLNDGSGNLVDISTTNYIDGTATLAFTNNRQIRSRFLRSHESSSSFSSSNNKVDDEEKLVKVVRFGSSSSSSSTTPIAGTTTSTPRRKLQQYPVNEFEMDVNLATPPKRSDRSTAARSRNFYSSSSSVVGLLAASFFASTIMVDGLLDFIF